MTTPNTRSSLFDARQADGRFITSDGTHCERCGRDTRWCLRSNGAWFCLAMCGNETAPSPETVEFFREWVGS
jgi:hypothetical protein